MKKITLGREELRSKEHMKSITLFTVILFQTRKWLKDISELLFWSTINSSAPSL